MTDGILSTVKEWAGERPVSCPWRAFFDPFTARVVAAHRMIDQIAWTHPDPSRRFVEGVSYYDAALKRCEAMRMRKEREERERGH
jgi:hypothetical protein